MTSSVEHSFMYLFAIHISSLVRYLLNILPIFYLVFVMLMCFKTSLCILGTSTLLICKYFPYDLHFNSLNSLLGILNFGEVQFINFFNGSVFAIKSKKYLLTSMSLRFSLEVV